MNRIGELIKTITPKRLIISLVGGFIVGVGVMMLSVSGLGADAPTVFREGVFKTFGVSQGTVNIIMGVIMAAATYVMDYKQLGIGTIANIFTMSCGMDLCKSVISGFEINAYLLLALGLVVIAIGVGMQVAAKLGASYYDAFCLAGGKMIRKNYSIFRYPIDAICLIVGYLLKGTIGIGTIICLLFIGPIIDLGIKIFGIIFKDL